MRKRLLKAIPLVPLALSMDYKVNYQYLFQIVAIKGTQDAREKNFKKKKNGILESFLSLHTRIRVKMINNNVSNKDFIDCGVRMSCSTYTPFGAAFQRDNG